MSKTPIRATTATILSAVLALGACGPLPPTRVLAPIHVDDRNSTVPAARLSWHSDGPDTRPGTSNFGVEVEYARGTGRSDQQVAGNEYISLGGANLLGPQNVRHRAELRYGHLALRGITRFRGGSGLELQWVAGLGRTVLDLRSESRTTADPTLTAKYQVSGVTLGVGPRWNITNEAALEGRVQVLWSRAHWSPASSNSEFWYPEVALRYRPVKNAALRVGYSGMGFSPGKNRGDDSPIEVRIAGPFLGLDAMF
jgi:hypothetical protein